MTYTKTTPKTNWMRRATAAAALAAAVAGGTGVMVASHAVVAAPAGGPVAARGVLGTDERPGVTRPCDEGNLVFAAPGVVKKVHVKAGDHVKAGQLLAEQDDAEEVAKLAILQVEAKSDVQIRAAQAQLEAKKVEYERRKALYKDLIAKNPPQSNSELDEARVDVQIAELSVEKYQQDMQQKGLEVKAQEQKIGQKRMVSPIDGIVAKVDIHAGEGTDLTKPAIQVVQNQKLWVEVDVPSARAKALQPGATLQIRYTDEEAWMPGTIIFVTPYASAGSNTRRVRMEMANTDPRRPDEPLREAGLPVVVKLPEPGGAAGGPAAAAQPGA